MRQGDLLAGRFRIAGHLERSRRGEVWLARDEARDAPCEVEALRPSGFEGEEAVRLLAREVEVARRLEGKRFLVRALGYGALEDGEAWIARESAPGAVALNLVGGDVIARVARVARAARVVATLHEAGAVHRDLGPGSVLMTAEGEVRLASLAFARLDGVPEPSTLPSRPPLAHPACAAPELLDQPERATMRADVHALGALLFRAVSGAWPWGDALVAVTRAQERVRCGFDDPPRPRRVAKDVSPVLDAICGEALEVDPTNRAPSAAALAEVLEAWIAEAAPPPAPPVASPPQEISPPPPLPAPAPLPALDPLFVPEGERVPPAAFADMTVLDGEDRALVVQLPARALERAVVDLRRLDPRGAPCLLVDMRRVQHLGGPQLEALTELLSLSERRSLPIALFALSKPLRQLLRLMDLEAHVPTLLDADEARVALEQLKARTRSS